MRRGLRAQPRNPGLRLGPVAKQSADLRAQPVTPSRSGAQRGGGRTCMTGPRMSSGVTPSSTPPLRQRLSLGLESAAPAALPGRPVTRPAALASAARRSARAFRACSEGAEERDGSALRACARPSAPTPWSRPATSCAASSPSTRRARRAPGSAPPRIPSCPCQCKMTRLCGGARVGQRWGSERMAVHREHHRHRTERRHALPDVAKVDADGLVVAKSGASRTLGPGRRWHGRVDGSRVTRL